MHIVGGLSPEDAADTEIVGNSRAVVTDVVRAADGKEVEVYGYDKCRAQLWGGGDTVRIADCLAIVAKGKDLDSCM